MAEPITKVWELRSPATIEDTWAVFSDTDRFNRVAELGFKFEQLQLSDGSVRRTGKGVFFAGITAEWEELPWSWKAPEWYRSTRRFLGGPAEEMTVQLRLRPEADGTTAVRYSVSVTPRNFLLRPIVLADLSLSSAPKVERALSALLTELSGRGAPPCLAPPPLAAEAEATLDRARIEPAPIKAKLAEALRTLPLREQDRLMPLRLAAEWKVDPDTLILGMLQGVREGVLAMRWELICPSCVGPAQRTERISEAARVHCSSCNIWFDRTFPDAVAVSFRAAPALRPNEVPVECVGSPAKQPIVILRERLEPEAQSEHTLHLKPGAYRVRTWPPRESAILDVLDTPTGDGTASFAAHDEGVDPPRIVVGPGEQRVTLSSRASRAVEIAIERTVRPPDVLSAGRLLGLPQARGLLPAALIDPNLKVESLRFTTLGAPPVSAGQLDHLERVLRAHSPRRLIVGDRGALATFDTFAQGLTAARALLAAGYGAALSVGSAVEVQQRETDPVVPMGAPVDEALSLLAEAAPGRLLLGRGLEQDPEVSEALRAAGLAALVARLGMVVE
ncbi:MAG: hypothetical protein IPI35_17630 [Deltaproteobacteria bacterium]|nr:hypothetical protein [Deltaproteobacteria bacterium]